MRSLITWIQTFFGATKSELTVVAILVAGLAAGIVVRTVSSSASEDSALNAAEVDALIDSIAAVEQTTYTGITPDGTAVPELATGDTLVVDERAFPTVAKAVPAGVTDLNTATKQELMSLPGVGAATADKIIESRNRQPFRRPEDILRVKGIGIKKFEAMRQYIAVGSKRQHNR